LLIENFPFKAFFNEKLDFQLLFSAFNKNFDILFHSWKDLKANNTCHLVFFFSVKLNLAFIFSVIFFLSFSVFTFQWYLSFTAEANRSFTIYFSRTKVSLLMFYYMKSFL